MAQHNLLPELIVQLPRDIASDHCVEDALRRGALSEMYLLVAMKGVVLIKVVIRSDNSKTFMTIAEIKGNRPRYCPGRSEVLITLVRNIIQLRTHMEDRVQ